MSSGPHGPILFIPVCDFLLLLTTKPDINYYQIINGKLAYVSYQTQL